MSDIDYNRLLGNNITGNYRKWENGVKHKIDNTALPSNTKCRLINPAKNELRLVSKKHLEKIIGYVANTIKVSQWRNTTTVIDWFKFLPPKDKSRFIKFDIIELYPSISEGLLNRSISFARFVTTISNSVINIIHHPRKSLLFDKTSAWVKKGNNSLFDVTMGSYDGAEICELVGLYLLSPLSTVIDKSNVGLYRDDGLAAINNANGPKLDRIRKDIIALFKEEGLSITTETNLIETDLLDITFNLATKKYFPFRKATVTTHHSISTPFPTTHLQLSTSCLKWSTREFQIYLVIRKNWTKLNLSTNQH